MKVRLQEYFREIEEKDVRITTNSWSGTNVSFRLDVGEEPRVNPKESFIFSKVRFSSQVDNSVTVEVRHS